ncbi:hypothetical protein HT136_07500 [Novosphingobium profundi]|uniref:hypothetical protein n=1 Tax=Novosphingobium profundi TaxID=1774954 RepID=UPI001BDB4D23|nr:hypothetical protein [Novosphingobium profundi]MBT0668209.1 hypothetical protein [Novosphingobium profundi]
MSAAPAMPITTPANPRAYNRPDRATLVDADVGRVGAAVLALTRELWVLTDRMLVLEEILGQSGIDVAAQIESFQPGPELQARLDTKGKQLVETIVAALAGTEAE